MLSPNDLAAAFARNVFIVKRQTDGLSHADSLIQLPFQGNPLNWVLGHVAVNRDDVLALLDEPPVMTADGKRYKRESDPLTGQEEDILPLEELLARLDQSQERIAAALGRMSEADMARELTLSNDRKMTLGQRVFFYYFHETYHVGQTELLRQLAGKHDKVI
ncbi:MAG TPA: DinB family protein [Ktedonobacterales bacterium]|nr:DinB family protein [Ktedonobacterales bacterium]